MSLLRVETEFYDDDEHSSIRVLRTADNGYSSIDPELERLVAKVIREYPNTAAPQWLAPVAAILVVEQWILSRVPQEEPASA